MASIDVGAKSGGRKSVDAVIPLVPFIDLFLCCIMFLLVTAVWVNVSQLSVEPAGRSRESGDPCERDPDCDKPKLSVLVDSDQIWIGVSRVNEFESIPKVNGQYDWQKLEERLKAQKASSFFLDATNIEIAAQSTHTSPVTYQNLVAAMDVAVGGTSPPGQ